jgi:glycerophosphoryl diester phosphodiesterase
MIEIDIHLTKDGEPVVIHDFVIERISNGRGRISNMNLSELKTYDFGSWFSSEFLGEQIPTLDEVFKLCKNKILIDLELKCSFLGKFPFLLIEKVSRLIHEYDFTRSILITSFNWKVIRKIKDKDPGFITGLLVGNFVRKFFAIKYAKVFKVPILVLHYKLVNKRFIEKARKKKISVFTYTVNHPDLIRKLKSYEIDGIITDGIELSKNRMSGIVEGGAREKESNSFR